MATRQLHRADGPHGPLVVTQTGTERELHFDNGIIQTRIDLQDPGHLPLAANRAMLAHLAFGQRPRQVLLAGCGGGAIARWFAAHSPATRGTAVELDPQVAALAKCYFEFPASWRLQIGDVRKHLAGCTGRYDFILVDIEAAGRTPHWVADPTFLHHCHRALTAAGVATFNLVAEDRDSLLAKLISIRQAFAQRTLCLSVPNHDNLLVLAFRRRPALAPLDRQLPARMARWGLEFDRLLARMRRQNPPGSGLF